MFPTYATIALIVIVATILFFGLRRTDNDAPPANDRRTSQQESPPNASVAETNSPQVSHAPENPVTDAPGGDAENPTNEPPDTPTPPDGNGEQTANGDGEQTANGNGEQAANGDGEQTAKGNGEQNTATDPPTSSPEPDNGNHETQGSPDGNSGEIIVLNDAGLYANAGNVYYGVYYFASGDYSTSGASAKTPSASVIKVFIMEYAFSQNTRGLLDLDGTLNGRTILSLITSMIQQSDNNSTNALIDHFGMGTLNAFFLLQGYADTVLERRMLDLDRRAAGYDNYTSLDDCMSFLKKLYANQDEEPYRNMMDIMKGQQIRTKIPLKLPGGVTVASKTGELNDVENDIGIVFAESSPFAIVVLSGNVRNPANMRTAIADLALSAYNNAGTS